MDYQQFLEEMQKKIREALPEYLNTAEIEHLTIKKNNNTTFEVISIKRPEDEIGAQFYMEDYYRDYQRGKSMERIAGEIIENRLTNEEIWENILPFDAKDYNQVKDHLIVQLISKDTNEELLKETPHTDLEHTNLTAIYRVNIDANHSFMVKDAMLKYWDISAEELHEKARTNTMEQNPFQLMDILDAVHRTMGIEVQHSNGLDKKLEPNGMYVLTNQSMMWGASAMLYPEVLEKIAENAESNYYILPSSIHESIVICDNGVLSAEDLQMLVMDINHTEVAPEEVLSNDVYYYDKDEQKLSMATSREQTAEFQSRFSDIELQPETEIDTEFER